MAKQVVQSMAKELVFMRQKYSVLLSKFMKLDLMQNFMKTTQIDVETLFKKTRQEFNEKFDKQVEENGKLKRTLQLLEEKKKITIRDGKRRILATDPEQSFIILSANNDQLKKEVNEKNAEISILKRTNQDLNDQNLQIKAELFKLVSLVKIGFFGSAKQHKYKEFENREIETQPNKSVDIDDSINWGSMANQMIDEIDAKAPPRFPGLKLDLDGFPGVDNRENDELLKRGPSEPLFANLATNGGEANQIEYAPQVARLIRNYKTVLYHNRLLTQAFIVSHE